MRNKYQQTGKKDFWSKYQRKTISAPLITTGTPLFSQYQEVFNRVLL
ncbi:unnamed protein product, partial [Schistosoma curassoni]|uniref:Transposase n=1 Tax=Schistosoma curassoni TaxID=6186 RepID=A0A183KIA6_9TREM